MNKMKYKIEFEKENCRGCGACTQCDNWQIGDDGLAFPLEKNLDEIGCNSLAAEICPVKIIKIIGNKE